MVLEPGLAERMSWLDWKYLVQATVAIAFISLAMAMLGHRHLVDALERPLLVWLALLLASAGVGQLLAAQPVGFSQWLLGAWALWLAGLGIYGAGQLRQRLPVLQLRRQRQGCQEPEQDLITGLPNYQGLALAYEQIRNYYTGAELEHTLLRLQTGGLQALHLAYGASVEDTVVMLIAQLLNDKTRSLDTVARTGEEEFGILLAGCSLPEGLLVAEGLRDGILGLQVEMLGASLPLVVNLGAAPFTQTVALEECWALAERALHQAKQRGNGEIAVPPPIRLLPLSVAYEAP